MAVPACSSGGGADPDVGPGPGRGVTGEKQDRREPQRSEDEADRRTEITGDERRRKR
jgi:hypothetical protein